MTEVSENVETFDWGTIEWMNYKTVGRSFVCPHGGSPEDDVIEAWSVGWKLLVTVAGDAPVFVRFDVNCSLWFERKLPDLVEKAIREKAGARGLQMKWPTG